jgi:REP element-mobilizing transposase RayT
MPQSLSQVYIHIVFSTKNRKDLIDQSIESKLFEYLGGTCNNLDCQVLQVGGHKNHVHILCKLSRKITQMKLVEEIKKGSSAWMKTLDAKYNNFYWQRGYGVFSVDADRVPVLIEYIKNQEKHHAKVSFKDEYRAFLEAFNIEYDEQYVWD